MTSDGPTSAGAEPPPGPGSAGGHPQQPTQAVPGYTPSSTYPPPHRPPGIGGATPPAGTGTGPVGPGGGQRALLAGVLGGLLALALVTGTAVILTRDDGAPEDDPTRSEPGHGGPEATSVGIDPRIGSTVGGIGLLSGDCIDFDGIAGNIDAFDVVSCETPHVAEVTAQVEHPDAGRAFPGFDELARWSADRCRSSTEAFIGADVLETTLAAITLVPDFDDWAGGLFRVSCLVTAADGGRLTESVRGKGDAYPRSTQVVVGRLRPGDCFDPGPGLTAFQLGADDLALLADCGAPHDGLFFGRAVLAFGPAEPFPGIELIDERANELCDAEFARFFGVQPSGLNYRFWSPDEQSWNLDDRTVHCAVMDERGLSPNLDFTGFRPMFELPVGQCFLFGPEETAEALGLDDRVEPVDCSGEHHGELFGHGELEPTGEPFPGIDALDTEIAERCIDLFTDYVGITPFDSVSGDFVYWYPNETGWGDGDLRWACALLTDETSTGSIAGTNA